MFAVRWKRLECWRFLFRIERTRDEAIAPAAQEIENEVGTGTLDGVNGLWIVGAAIGFAEEVGEGPS